MATIVLAAAGSAIGGAIGGTVAGLSAAVIGRAVGATLGRVIDARLMGGSDAVETGRVDRFRLTQGSEGEPVARVFGRMRIGGQVIWASDFQETRSTTRQGGKGSAPGQDVTSYSYTVSLAVALCEGEITRVARVWADGEELDLSSIAMTTYRGSADQLPDPLIEAIEGAGQVPAYRGTAYVVFEDLPLGPFGNRVPQLSFEVLRAEDTDSGTHDTDLAQIVEGVALMPGTGEYALAASPVYMNRGPGDAQAVNLSSASGGSDLQASLAALEEELPKARAVSLVVSWFGDDLRCGDCRLRPKVEQKLADGSMPWEVSGLTRAAALEVAVTSDGDEDAPVYGGTPADAAVVEAIRDIRDRGQRVMFYPFILMEQLAGNTLPNPWTGAEGQPVLPWRGRITTSLAPGVAGSPDGTALADTEVAAFMGTVQASDFTVSDGTVSYTGPEEWSFSRFILHYAALCAAAGGVDAFCVGSELRGLTQIRGAAGFPMVAGLRALTAEVRALLGAEVDLGYAADWSEYWGYQSPEGDRYFHLDPLWADAEIDFIGIDNYMPLSDWREGADHLDAAEANAIYELAYLQSGIEGGEGFDWFYPSPEARDAQRREPITDAAHDEPWIWRYKDLRSWWALEHHERIGGIRQDTPTDWQPESKPIWFTELGCAAIDKGTNQPNVFLDPKSSESFLPYYSNGLRDDLLQQQYLRAQLTYWSDAGRNPVSAVYDAPMLDLSNAYVWAWDARPYPAFPTRGDLWSDGPNYLRGHWLNGRVGQRTLASVVAEICADAGLRDIDVSDLWGVVRGYGLRDVDSARAALQPLMLRHGFDTIERAGQLVFRPRKGLGAVDLVEDQMAEHEDLEGRIERLRDPEAELSGRVRVSFVEAGGDFAVQSEEAVLPDEATHAISHSDLPMALTRGEGRQVVHRWLAEARVGRDRMRFALPPSKLGLGAGDIVAVDGASYRIDRVDLGAGQLIEAQRIEAGVYDPATMPEDMAETQAFAAPLPVLPLFLDLPLITGDEVEHAPHLAVTAASWPGTVAVYGADLGAEFALEEIIATRATLGQTLGDLPSGPVGRWDLGADLEVQLIAGALETLEPGAVLAGGNRLAIGDGSPENWEILQFQEAELIGPNRYLLRNRLRGQYGTDGLMPEVWPAGSYVVLLDDRVGQIDLAASQRRVARNWRIGPARRSFEDPSYVAIEAAFEGAGLRPYAPAHLAVDGALGADVTLSWIRRTRIDGDDWTAPEVPLGEESESYLLRVISGSTVLREEILTTAAWTYDPAAQSADGVVPGDRVEVAQLSRRFGAGLFAAVALV